MNKRVFTIIIALLLAAFVPKAYGQGSGTADDPILISNADQLKSMGYSSGKHYKLGNDIVLTGTWTPISKELAGTLDGDGHVISGLDVSVSEKAGLFETISESGIVKNLGVIGTVTASSSYAFNYAGGIAGKNEGTIQNCYTNVTVTDNTDDTDCYAGGIAGENTGTIENCYTTGTVTNKKGCSGGIAGKSSNTKKPSTIQYCYATGAIEGRIAGGIVGGNYTGKVLYCIALNDSITGAATSRITVGNGSLTANHAALSIPGPLVAADKVADGKNGADLTAAFATDGATTGAFANWTATNWTFDDNTKLPQVNTDGGALISGQAASNRAGYLVAPVLIITTITTEAELVAIKDNLSGFYKLGNDIVLTGTWAPISGRFTGTLDGDGHVIRGLNVSVDGDAGLFEIISESGIVKNLGVIGSVTSICTSRPSYYRAGGIAGTNYGIIQNCYTSVAVTCTPTHDMYYAGGIAGENNGVIQNCYTTGTVTNKKSYAGGIAGANSNDRDPSSIQYCYATGAIDGNSAGGIAGTSYYGTTSHCIALNASITGTTIGRIAGGDGSPTANHAALSIPGIWAAADKVADGKNGADLTVAFATDGATTGAFTNWEATHWDFTTAANLPILKGFKTADQPVKDMKRAPFLLVPVTTIKTQAELAAIKENLAGSYKLENDITLTGNWTPLGDNETPFTGTLDGCGYSISKLTVNVTGNNNAGLFGYIGKDGTVKNLGVTGSVTLTDATNSAHAGGIAGYSAGKITNCYTNVTVSATGSSFIYAGGIVGRINGNAAAISNCFATGNCTANSSNTAIAGGIVGDASPGRERYISYCFATGTVEAKGEAKFKSAGGIVGQKGGSITGCIALNKGGITGTTANRIAGNSFNASTIADCYASPTISGTWSNIGADKPDGADLTIANFFSTNDAFTNWNTADWAFKAGDFAGLPTLMTTGLTPNIPLVGQTDFKRVDYLGFILIDKEVTYDATLHKDRHLVITSTGNLNVSVPNAQVDSLEIEQGGQVTTTTTLGVTKAISTTRTLENKWSTFGVPIEMTLSVEEGTHILGGYVTSKAADQKWSATTSPYNPISLLTGSSCMLASDGASAKASFSSTAGTPIPVSAKAESGSALSNGIFLFRTNPSLSNQTVTNVYILNEDGTRFELQKEAYTLKPFECYMMANAITTKAVQSLRIGDGILTGNDPITLPSDAFRLWTANGQLHLEASQPADVQIYTLTGTLAHSFRLDGSRTLTLPRGIYLVRSNNITYKISL